MTIQPQCDTIIIEKEKEKLKNEKWVVNFFDGDTILDVVDTREQAFEVARAFYMREVARGEIDLEDALEYIQVLENDNDGIGIAIYEDEV